MKMLPIAVVLAAVTLTSTGCLLGHEQHTERETVVERRPERERVVVVERQAPPPVVVERERVVVVHQEPPVVYREVYVEGRPAPRGRVEVVPTRPRHDAVWVQGHWEHERGDHDDNGRDDHGHDKGDHDKGRDKDKDGHDKGDHWGWHGGYWR